jgi:hypothetical protein
MTLAYPVRMEMHTFNMRVWPLKPLIQGGHGTQVPQGTGFGSQECMAPRQSVYLQSMLQPRFSRKRRNPKQVTNMSSNGGWSANFQAMYGSWI